MTKPRPGLSRFDMSAFLVIAWAGAGLGAVLAVLGVIGAIQAGEAAYLLISLAAVLIGLGGWYNVRLVRKARRAEAEAEAARQLLGGAVADHARDHRFPDDPRTPDNG